MKTRQLVWPLFLGVAFIGALAIGLVAYGLHLEEQAGADPSQADYALVLSVGGAALVAIFGWIFLITSRWTRVLKRLTRAARDLSHGDLRARAEIGGADDFALLARSLNHLRDRLASQAKTIDQQQRALEDLLDRIHEGVIIAGADSRIVAMNSAAMELLNLPTRQRRSLIGAAVERCVANHDLQRMLTASPEKRTLTDSGTGAPGEVEEARIQVEVDKALRHLLARAADVSLPVTSENGRPQGRLLVLMDITKLEQTLQMKADFVTNASHELRTPLSTIRTAIETLQQLDLETETDDARNFMRVIDRQSARLAAMVSDLLDLARVESSLARFEPRELSAREVLDDVYDRNAEGVLARRVRWERVIDDSQRGSFSANPHLLKLTLDNLVENAIKFTEPGKLVRVSYRGEPERVIFEVKDEGCGIPEGERERVFERFYQVERARSGSERGTGLGLAIVRHAVLALGGTVDLESAVGLGTTVTVTIPVARRKAIA